MISCVAAAGAASPSSASSTPDARTMAAFVARVIASPMRCATAPEWMSFDFLQVTRSATGCPGRMTCAQSTLPAANWRSLKAVARKAARRTITRLAVRSQRLARIRCAASALKPTPAGSSSVGRIPIARSSAAQRGLSPGAVTAKASKRWEAMEVHASYRLGPASSGSSTTASPSVTTFPT